MRRDLEGAFVFLPGSAAMEGQSGSAGGYSADTSNFVSTSDSRRAIDGVGYDYSEVGYVLYQGREDGLLSLYRREDHMVDEMPFSGGSLELLDDSVRGLRFEYLTSDGWQSVWQGEGLPEAVRVTLTLQRDTGKRLNGEPVLRDHDFSAIALIPAGRSW